MSQNIDSMNITECFNEALIKIPFFQRPFDWTLKENIAPLIADICEDIQSKDDGLSVKGFIGSICVYREESDEGRCHFVIDGQQRLTSVALILATSLFYDLHPDDREDIYAILSTRDLNDDNPRVMSFASIHPFINTYLQEVILNKVTEVGEGSLQLPGLPHRSPRDKLKEVTDGALKSIADSSSGEVKRARKIAKIITSLGDLLEDPDSYGDDRISCSMKDIIRQITLHTECVRIISRDLSSALRDFEKLNSRSVPLSPVDVVKARVAELLPSEEVHNKQWAPIEDAHLSSPAETKKALRRLVMVGLPVSRFRDVSQGKILDEFRLPEFDNYLTSFPQDFIHSFADAVRVRSRMTRGKDPFGNPSPTIKAMNYIGVSELCAIPLVAYSSAVRSGCCEKEDFDVFAREIWKVIFVLTVARVQSKAAEKFFLDVSRALHNEGDWKAALRDMSLKIRSRYSSQFRAGFSAQEIDGTARERARTLYSLLSIETHLDGTEGMRGRIDKIIRGDLKVSMQGVSERKLPDKGNSKIGNAVILPVASVASFLEKVDFEGRKGMCSLQTDFMTTLLIGRKVEPPSPAPGTEAAPLFKAPFFTGSDVRARGDWLTEIASELWLR